MRRSARVVTVLLPLLLTTAAWAQDRVYVNFQDSFLVGESTDAAHPGWVDAYGLEHSAIAPVNFSPITFLKGVDRASPRLSWLVAGANTLANDVIIDVCREPAGGPQQCYYQLTLRGARVSAVSLAGQACIDPSTCGASQSESIELAWNQLKWIFTKYDSKGGSTTFQACYDSATGKYACF